MKTNDEGNGREMDVEVFVYRNNDFDEIVKTTKPAEVTVGEYIRHAHEHGVVVRKENAEPFVAQWIPPRMIASLTFWDLRHGKRLK